MTKQFIDLPNTTLMAVLIIVEVIYLAEMQKNMLVQLIKYEVSYSLYILHYCKFS